MEAWDDEQQRESKSPLEDTELLKRLDELSNDFAEFYREREKTPLPDIPEECRRKLESVKLLRILKAYAYPAEEISFRRFSWLNVWNIMLYEDELMGLDVKYAMQTDLSFTTRETRNLRTLLKEYSTSVQESRM